jgi:hypothetical protein
MNDARNVRRQRRAGYTTIGHRSRSRPQQGSLHTADFARLRMLRQGNSAQSRSLILSHDMVTGLKGMRYGERWPESIRTV